MADALTLLVFSSKSCSACKAMKSKKVVELFNTDVPAVKVEQISTDGGEGEERADLLGVQALPTLIFMRDGAPIHRIDGAPTLNQLKAEHAKAVEKAAKAK